MCYINQLKAASLAFLLTILLTSPSVLAKTADPAPGPAPESEEACQGQKVLGLDDFSLKYGATHVKKFGHRTKIEIPAGKAQTGDALEIANKVVRDAAAFLEYDPQAMMYVTQVAKADGSTKIRYCQTFQGLHVYGTCLEVLVDSQKRVLMVQCRTEQKLADVPTSPQIDAKSALQVAESGLGIKGKATQVTDPQLMILAIGDESHLVWWLRLNTVQPTGSWVALVDAVDSDMVLSRNLLDTY